MARNRTYAKGVREALSDLGKAIRVGRKRHRMTAQELADRAGISRTTLHRIEEGNPGLEIGTVFEVASLLGLQLVGDDASGPRMRNARLEESLALLPKSVRRPVKEFDDDF